MGKRPNDATSISKFLSLVLRHKPEEIGLTLEDGGWSSVNDLLAAMARHGYRVTLEQLTAVVETNDKKRFSFNTDRSKIRAAQGHSVTVDLGYSSVEPPERLYHGTVDRFLASIRAQGLLKGQRHHVHLSADPESASRVGSRRGRPVVLIVKAAAMVTARHQFFRSENGVWLTEHVPTSYIVFPSS
jgi:putative RNA 2'-phosphotransferase